MHEEDIDPTLKVIVVGNGQVGKTSMITRFAKGVFTEAYKKTIGVDFLEKKMYIPSVGEELTLFVWDTAGQEEYDAVTRTYYKGAGACILAFSTTDRASFDAVERWNAKVQDECGKIATVLVQNKIDLMEDAAMEIKEVEFLAKKLNLKLYRTCVKDDLNVSEVFMHLGSEFLNKGGQLAHGATAITAIEDVASKPIADRMGSSSNLSGSLNSTGSDKTPGLNNDQPFKLSTKKPSVQRTGGKKHTFSCCIL